MAKNLKANAKVASDWKKGSPIVWKAEWKGTSYEDNGVILDIEPVQRLRHSHFSPLSGLPDVPENYHTVTINVSPKESGTLISLSQDKNVTEEERHHSRKNWRT